MRSEIVVGIADAVFWRALASNYDLVSDYIAITQPGFTDFNRCCDSPVGI